MLLSLLAYLGVTGLLTGALALLRPRPFLIRDWRVGAGLVAFGLLLASAGAWWPVRLRASSGRTLLDAFAPEFQFREFHSTEVSASPDEVFRALRSVSAGEIRFFRALTWIRSPRLPARRGRESILNPDWQTPILDVALRSGFVLLREDWGKEIVVGTVLCCGQVRAKTARAFRALDAPGYTLAALNFRVVRLAEHTSRLTTETRIVARGGDARRRFGLYWSFIYPGSSLIRYGWLEAIRRRAENLSSSRRRASRWSRIGLGRSASHVQDGIRVGRLPL